MLRDDANERAVEDGLLAHVEKFLLELGAGFALVGRQVHLEVGDQDFCLDLLFYHLKLRCFVVIDLKARDFTPEAAGKMNFYLAAVDDRFRQRGDQPAIGLILGRSKNRMIFAYVDAEIERNENAIERNENAIERKAIAEARRDPRAPTPWPEAKKRLGVA